MGVDSVPYGSRMTIREHVADIFAAAQADICGRADETHGEGVAVLVLRLRGDLVPEALARVWVPGTST